MTGDRKKQHDNQIDVIYAIIIQILVVDGQTSYDQIIVSKHEEAGI